MEKTVNYNTLDTYISLEIECDCGEKFTTDALAVPTANYAADNHLDSENEDEFEEHCPACGQLYQIILRTGMWHAEAQIESDKNFNVLNIIEDETDSYEDFYTEWYHHRFEELHNTLKSIDVISDTQAKNYLLKLLYANAITVLEVFWASTLKSIIDYSSETKEQFVKEYYKSSNFGITDMVNSSKVIDGMLTNSLNKIVFHKYKDVVKLYNMVDIDFEQNKDIDKAIQLRHDIVHRNGKDTNGKIRDFTKDDVIVLIQIISEYIDNISQIVSAKYPPKETNDSSSELDDIFGI